MQTINNLHNIQLDNGQLRITPEKRFDYFTCTQLEDVFKEILLTDQPPQVIVDLSKTQFVDMPAINMLVNLSNSAQQCDGSCKFINVNPKIRIILDLTGTQLNSIQYLNEEN